MYICSMSAIDLRNKLQELMQYANDMDLANAFDDFVKIYKDENKIVAYTVQGEPLTKEMYIKKVKDAETGKFISSEELKKQMLSW